MAHFPILGMLSLRAKSSGPGLSRTRGTGAPNSTRLRTPWCPICLPKEWDPQKNKLQERSICFSPPLLSLGGPFRVRDTRPPPLRRKSRRPARPAAFCARNFTGEVKKSGNSPGIQYRKFTGFWLLGGQTPVEIQEHGSSWVCVPLGFPVIPPKTVEAQEHGSVFLLASL